MEEAVPFFTGRVNKVRRQLRKSDTDVVTITALRGGCVTLAEGIGGVQYGSRPVPVDQQRVPRIRDVAVEWFVAVADAIGVAIENREKSLASASSVMAAIGAVGHELVNISDSKERATKREELIERLRLVRWDKGEIWHGIAGKLNPTGNFSVAGSKEAAYGIYAALTDRNSEGYKRIRGQVVGAA